MRGGEGGDAGMFGGWEEVMVEHDGMSLMSWMHGGRYRRYESIGGDVALPSMAMVSLSGGLDG